MKKLLAFLLLVPALAFAQISIPGGIYWPYGMTTTFQNSTNATLDAAGEKAAHCGYVYWNGGGSKTIDNSANSKIAFVGGAAITFANGSTTVDLGFQSANTSGPIIQPTGTFLGGTAVKRTLVGGTDTITASAWNEFALNSAGTSFTLAQGDLTCVVLDMTARGGADSLQVNTMLGISNYAATTPMLPITNANNGAWQTAVGVGAGLGPAVTFTANDGTLGWLGVAAVGSNEAWNDGSNPDERAQFFQCPGTQACVVDALWTSYRSVDTNSTGTLTLYSDCSGTPTSMASVNIVPTQVGPAATDGPFIGVLASPVSLSASTTYCVALRATHATSNVRVLIGTLLSAGARALLPGSTNISTGGRQNGSGAFSTSTSTTKMYSMGVRLSSIGSAGGSGGGVY